MDFDLILNEQDIIKENMRQLSIEKAFNKKEIFELDKILHKKLHNEKKKKKTSLLKKTPLTITTIILCLFSYFKIPIDYAALAILAPIILSVLSFISVITILGIVIDIIRINNELKTNHKKNEYIFLHDEKNERRIEEYIDIAIKKEDRSLALFIEQIITQSRNMTHLEDNYLIVYLNKKVEEEITDERQKKFKELIES